MNGVVFLSLGSDHRCRNEILIGGGGALKWKGIDKCVCVVEIFK